MVNWKSVYFLGIKEIKSLFKDPVLSVFILYAFTLGIYLGAVGKPQSLSNITIGVVDEDQSVLSKRIVNAFLPPEFIPPMMIDQNEMEKGLQRREFTFALTIPPYFQREITSGKGVSLQLNVDATNMAQSFTGNMYIQSIIGYELAQFFKNNTPEGSGTTSIELKERALFNTELNGAWFGAINQLINFVTTLSIVLVGAALIREREHGTLEHLLVMPVTTLEIMLSKIWSMGFVILVLSMSSMIVVIQGFLQTPVEGSLILFALGICLQLFAATSLGIFLSSISKTMPQFSLLLILTLLPLQLLSGGMTPRESMPMILQYLTLVAPNTHFVMLSQAILFRGAGLEVAWPNFVSLIAIGGAFFTLSHLYLKPSIGKL